MSYLDAILLGLVQGVAEFLPISSSGHLVILEHLLGLGPEGDASAGPSTDLTALNVALHFGSLMSILVVFRHDLPKVLRDRQLMTAIVVATLPLIPIGLFLKDFVDTQLNTPLVAGCALCVTAALLLISQRFTPRETEVSSPAPEAGVPLQPSRTIERDANSVTWLDALIVGLFQAVALTPGISRSGSTIVAGLMRGKSRETAAKFAFLIAIPAIGGAMVLKAKDLLDAEMSNDLGPIAVGTLVSFVVGIASLSWLLKLITQRRLHWFGWYCLIAGLVVITWSSARS